MLRRDYVERQPRGCRRGSPRGPTRARRALISPISMTCAKARASACVMVRNECRRDHQARGPLGGGAMEAQRGGPSVADDLDVVPQSLGVTGAERLHRRFLGGEPAGQVRGGVAVPGTIGNLAVGEDPPQEAVAVARDRCRRRAGCPSRRCQCPEQFIAEPQPTVGFSVDATVAAWPPDPSARCDCVETIARHLFTSRSSAVAARRRRSGRRCGRLRGRAGGAAAGEAGASARTSRVATSRTSAPHGTHPRRTCDRRRTIRKW